MLSAKQPIGVAVAVEPLEVVVETDGAELSLYNDNRLPAPQASAGFPGQDMLQSAAGAEKEPEFT